MQIDLIEGLRSIWIGSNNPDTLIFQPREKRRETCNPRYRQVLHSSGRGSCDRRSDPGSAMFRDEEPVYSDSLRGANDRSEVLRVLNSIKQQQ